MQTEGGGLDGVRLVSDGEAELLEAALDVVRDHARLHAHEESLLVEPEDAVHAVHVHAAHHAALVRGALERARDGAAAAERDEADLALAWRA